MRSRPRPRNFFADPRRARQFGAMNRSWFLLLGALFLVNVSWGADFSRSLSPADFAAAGLDKLTPAELARLDALVEARMQGKVDKVQQEAAQQVATEVDRRVATEMDQRVETEVSKRVQAEVAKRVEAEVGKRVKEEVAKKEKSESLLHRMKVVLTPGTEIAYETVESTLVGPFLGYNPGTVFTLANGQKWQVVEGSYWSPKKEANRLRKVVIKPGVLGSFFMEIEGAGRAKVKIIFRGTEPAK